MDIAQVGNPAPPFTAPTAFLSDGPASPVRQVSLSDYAGKWLALLWYPMDFTFVCPTEITAFSDRLSEFHEIDTEVLGASTDSVYSHRAWMRTTRALQGVAGVGFPLLSDKTHDIGRRYGVLVEAEGIALRGLFLIDPNGVLQYGAVHNLFVGRSVDETLRVLQGLQSGGLCASDWKPGGKLL